MEPLPAIATRDLRKSYGGHLVLDGIDLEVTAGTVYALLGPNGSGKTTTVKILSTVSAALWHSARRGHCCVPQPVHPPGAPGW